MMVRDQLLDFLEKELVGPRPGLPYVQLNGEEVIGPEDTPRLRYGAGILFPAKINLSEQEDDATETQPADLDALEGKEQGAESTGSVDERADQRGDSQSETEQELNRTNEFLPSAMGITALMEIPETITVNVRTAQYIPKEYVSESAYGTERARSVSKYWFRTPLDCEVVIARKDLESGTAFSHEIKTANPETKLVLQVFIRDLNGSPSSRQRFVTFTLVNRTPPVERPRDEDCFFQAGFSVSAAGESACFLEYPTTRVSENASYEDASLSLLYRHKKIYAIGHGCSADWQGVTSEGATRISTQSLPRYEISPIAPSSLEDIPLLMRDFFTHPDEVWLARCQLLADRYAGWIEKQKNELSAVQGLSTVEAAAGSKNIDDCEKRLLRILGGIDLLRRSATARSAFRMMNEAMLMQHLHYGFSTEKRRFWVKGPRGLVLDSAFCLPDYIKSERRWRPFQLAFILSTIRSIALTDPRDQDERNMVDLIWFPTGGGKPKPI